MIKLNGRVVEFKAFPNNEEFADIQEEHFQLMSKGNQIVFKFENNAEIFHLICLKKFLDNVSYGTPCHLILPYVPYSRMDRQENKRLFTLKFFCETINEMGFHTVTCFEPHSDVTSGLLDRVRVVNKSMDLALRAIRDVLGLKGEAWFIPGRNDIGYGVDPLLEKAAEAGVYLIYPDSGAEKRYSKQIKYKKVLTCSKHRDFDSGDIQYTHLNDVENIKDCKIAIIVDDLCSKGGTFMGAGSEIHRVFPDIEQVILCITHCEDNIWNGSIPTTDTINKVYTTNSILTKTDCEKFIVEDVLI